ncbi:MAG TPA: hypothetical protein VD970_09640 [Acetobacteraceae bacterium]|nr:hypothetical protein [Acetobacteraceae bacterium]
MPVVVGLPDTEGEISTRIIRSVAQARTALRSGLPSVTAAGPLGAVNLWRGSTGQWYGNVNEYGTVVAERAFPSRAAALRWLEGILPQLGDVDVLATPFGAS